MRTGRRGWLPVLPPMRRRRRPRVLAGGRSDVVDQACRAVADYFGFAECLFLPSGYQANLACVTTLLQQGQEAFVDRRCHASVMRALPLAGARIRAWNHLDYDHLERLLSSLPPDAPQPWSWPSPCTAWTARPSIWNAWRPCGVGTDFSSVWTKPMRWGPWAPADAACARRRPCGWRPGPGRSGGGHAGQIAGPVGRVPAAARGFTPLFEHLASAIMHSTALPPAHAACMLALVGGTAAP